MATKAARAKAIVDALTNRDMSAQNVTRVVDALLGLEPEQIVLMSVGDKTDRFLHRLRAYVLEQVKQYERKAAVKAAESSTSTQVETDFTEGV